MSRSHPHEHRLNDVRPQASWCCASCSREAHVIEGGEFDGPRLVEERADDLAREELQWPPVHKT